MFPSLKSVEHLLVRELKFSLLSWLSVSTKKLQVPLCCFSPHALVSVSVFILILLLEKKKGDGRTKGYLLALGDSWPLRKRPYAEIWKWSRTPINLREALFRVSAWFHSMNTTCDHQIVLPKSPLTESEPKITAKCRLEIRPLSPLLPRSKHRNQTLFSHLLALVRLMKSPSPHSAFCCHDSGATVLAMAPRNQLLITGGRKGWISILKLPHKLQRQSFQAHDSPVKALAVEPTEDCFISGSSEGNIRVIMSHSPVCLSGRLSSWLSASKVCDNNGNYWTVWGNETSLISSDGLPGFVMALSMALAETKTRRSLLVSDCVLWLDAGVKMWARIKDQLFFFFFPEN